MEKIKLKRKYFDDMSESYEHQRMNTYQWNSEQNIVSKCLESFPADTEVIDIPVGTGRFFDLYKKLGFKVTGIDISEAMLQKAIEKIPADTDSIVLEKGDIFSLSNFESYFDVAVCIRFTNWISSEDLRKALFELSRITKGKIIVYIPTYTQIKEFNLLYLKDLARLILQLKLRFYRKRKKSEQVIHEKSKIYDFFDQLDIEIEKVFCIDPAGGRNWMRGYERNIYLLSKIDAAK